MIGADSTDIALPLVARQHRPRADVAALRHAARYVLRRIEQTKQTRRRRHAECCARRPANAAAPRRGSCPRCLPSDARLRTIERDPEAAIARAVARVVPARHLTSTSNAKLLPKRLRRQAIRRPAASVQTSRSTPSCRSCCVDQLQEPHLHFDSAWPHCPSTRHSVCISQASEPVCSSQYSRG